MRRKTAKPLDAQKIFRRRNAVERERSREVREPGALLTPAALRIRNHAKSVLFEAIARKQLTRPDACSECGNTDRRIEAHQADFTKPLEVIWLCHTCNKPRRTERIAAYKAAMEAGGDIVAGLYVAGYNVRREATAPVPVKTLQAFSRKRGARGGDAATQQALGKVRAGKPTPIANAVVQTFIAADMERYLSGLPSMIGEVLAGKGAEVVVRPATVKPVAPPVVATLEVPADVVGMYGSYGDIVTFDGDGRDYELGDGRDYELVPVPGETGGGGI